MAARLQLRPISVALSVFALLLSLLTAATPAAAIDGGDDNVAQLPWVALLHITNARAAGDCTGSFISEEWILTARHCFDGMSGPVTVTMSAMQDGALERVGQGSEHFDHPEFDVSLVRVSQQGRSIPSFARLGNWVQNGEASAYGYGLTGPDSTSPASGTLKSARVNVFAFARRVVGNAVSMLLGYKVSAPWARVIQAFGVNGTTRSGDSGGPLMQDGAVVGIINHSGVRHDVRSNLSIATSVTQVFDWVSQTSGIAAKDLDAATIRSSYTTVLTSANGSNLTMSGNHVTLDTNHLASPLQIEFDGTWAFRLRSGDSCISTADVVNEMTMLVVTREILRMEPCDDSSFRQKFYLAAQSPTSNGKPRGVLRTVVGDQAVSLLGTGEVGLKGLDDEPILFVFDGSGTTTLDGLAPVLKTAGDTWANPRSIGKRDAPTLVARFIDTNGLSVDLPTPPGGVAILDSAVTSANGATAAILLGDDGHVYRSARPDTSTGFSPWVQLPGSGVTVISSVGAAKSFGYTAGTSVYAVDDAGTVRNFDTPAGVGAVDVAIGRSSPGDHVFVLGTDSRVYRYDIGGSSSPSQLPGEGIFTLAASDVSNGTVAYASARTVRIQRLDGSGAAYDLPAGVNPLELDVTATGEKVVATVRTSDGAVRQLSVGASGGGPSDIDVSVLVSAGRGVADARAVPGSIGQVLWADANSVTTTGQRCAPPSRLPSGEGIDSLATAVTSGGIVDHAVADTGAVYLSSNCQSWQRVAGLNGKLPAFAADGGVLTLRALERRSGDAPGSDPGPFGIGCQSTPQGS